MDKGGNRENETYLSFKMSGEVFAVEVSRIKSIVEANAMIESQYSDNLFKGIVHLKGSQVPVTDIRQKFGLPDNEITTDSSIIVLNLFNGKGVTPVGILTDVAREVLDVEKTILKNPSESKTKAYAAFIIKEFDINNRHIMILDPDRLFSPYETELLKNLAERVE